MLRRVAEPLETISENGDGRVAHGGAFHRPSVIADHYLVQRESFFGAADEHVAPKLGDRDHQSSLTHEPGVRWSVIHNPDVVGNFAREAWKASSHNESEVAKSLGREHRDLLLARVVLNIGCRIDQEPEAGLESDVRPAVLIPLWHSSPRLLYIVVHLARIDSGVERGRGIAGSRWRRSCLWGSGGGGGRPTCRVLGSALLRLLALSRHRLGN